MEETDTSVGAGAEPPCTGLMWQAPSSLNEQGDQRRLPGGGNGVGVSKPSLRAKASRQDMAGTSRKHRMPMKQEQERESMGRPRRGFSSQERFRFERRALGSHGWLR